MKIIGIDIDQLEEQAAELRKQLSDIEAVIRIVTKNGKPEEPIVASQAIAPPTAPKEPTPRQHDQNSSHERHPQAGARKAVCLALHTGPSTIKDLSRALVWEFRKVRVVLNSMEKHGFVSPAQGGLNALTDKGKAMARWFIAHPEYICYRPNLTNEK